MSNSDLLVLDEPTVAMDVEGRHEFWATMRGVAAGGKTVIFATHYLEEADAYADRIVLMAHGRVVADGPTTEIKALVGLAGHPGDPAAAPSPTDLGALAGVDDVELRGEADRAELLRLRLRHPRAAAPRFRRPATSRSPAPASKQAFLQLTGADADVPSTEPTGGNPMNTTYLQVRVAAHAAQPAGLHLLAGLPVRAVRHLRRVQPAHTGTSATRASRPSPTTWSACSASAPMGAVLAGGARIAVDRSAGWNRQLRLTPLAPRAYLATKMPSAT